MRNHEAIVIEEFNGLWARGDRESCPLDHFSDVDNVKYIQSGFETRPGLDVFNVGTAPGTIPNVVRIYMFVHNNEESLLVLDTMGNIYHTKSPTPFTPILSIPAMTDFAFVGFAGRAYISPHDGITGLQNEFLYVYLGDGSYSRKAGGNPPTGTLTLGLSATPGNVETGYHIFGVVYETNTGFLTQIGPPAPFPFIIANGTSSIDVSTIPISPDAFVVARHIVATKAIDPVFFQLVPDTTAYQFFFVPNGRIPDNTTTTLTVNFFDAELLQDASHLLDLFSEIAAGVALTTYHNRLVLCNQFGVFDPLPENDTLALENTARVSFPGEPEAFDQVTGLIVAPLDGTILTNGQEYRDVLYLFKRTRTYAYNDNGDVPATWPLTIIDQGIGASVHGIATVLDSGGINIEFLLIIDFSGVMQFNGTYLRPEMSWKIKDYWLALDTDRFHEMQVVNDTLGQIMYITLPNQRLMIGQYDNGLDPKNMKWGIWSFLVEVTSVALININQLVIGSKQLVTPIP